MAEPCHSRHELCIPSHLCLHVGLGLECGDLGKGCQRESGQEQVASVGRPQVVVVLLGPAAWIRGCSLTRRWRHLTQQ